MSFSRESQEMQSRPKLMISRVAHTIETSFYALSSLARNSGRYAYVCQQTRVAQAIEALRAVHPHGCRVPVDGSLLDAFENVVVLRWNEREVDASTDFSSAYCAVCHRWAVRDESSRSTGRMMDNSYSVGFADVWASSIHPA